MNHSNEDSESDLSGVWVVGRKPGFTISHPILAKAPGCPDTRHPTRWCKCRVFRSLAEANQYVTEFGGTTR